jgi:hypothetical protein
VSFINLFVAAALLNGTQELFTLQMLAQGSYIKMLPAVRRTDLELVCCPGLAFNFFRTSTSQSSNYNPAKRPVMAEDLNNRIPDDKR